MIKRLTTIATIVITSFFAMPDKAEANPRSGITIHAGYTSDGYPIYKKRFVRYYRECGTPVYGYRTLPIRRNYHAHRPRYRDNYYRYNRRYDRGYRYKARKNYRRYDGCDYRSSRRYRGSHISFSF